MIAYFTLKCSSSVTETEIKNQSKKIICIYLHSRSLLLIFQEEASKPFQKRLQQREENKRAPTKSSRKYDEH